MTWYAAHIIMYVRFKEREQKRFPLWENIVLIKADSADEAYDKAEKRGLEDAGDDDASFRWGNKPAEWIFGGVRKVTLCQDESKRPGDGTEVTYLEMEVASREDLEKLIRCEPVRVHIQDGFPDDEPINPPVLAGNGRKKSE